MWAVIPLTDLDIEVLARARAEGRLPAFVPDPGILAGQRIEEILRGIHHDAEPQDEAEADEEEG